MNDARYDPEAPEARTWRTPGGAVVKEMSNGYMVTPGRPTAIFSLEDTIYEMEPARPGPDLRTLDRREADDVAQLRTEIAGLAQQLWQRLDAIEALLAEGDGGK